MAALSADKSHGDDNHYPVFEALPGTLLHLLTNSLVLHHITPYLTVRAFLNLAATSRVYRSLLYGTPSVFRYLDLSKPKSAQLGAAPIDRGGETWRNVQLDENLTEDEFYSGPLRATFNALRRFGWLASVHTLILDNVAVTAELVYEIIRDPSYNVRILSLRQATHLNETQLQSALRTVCRPGRPAGTPRLQGLYVFGDANDRLDDKSTFSGTGDTVRSDRDNDVRHVAAGGTDLWYGDGRMVLSSIPSSNWAATLADCRGVLAFDAVLCRGPRHINSPLYGKMAAMSAGGLPYAVAQFSLGGCAMCDSAPEGWTVWSAIDDDRNGTRKHDSLRGDPADSAVSRFPLLWPPPRFASSARAAMCPEGASLFPRAKSGHRHEIEDIRREEDDSANASPRFIPRCMACLHDRMCLSCHRWWCEACLPNPADEAAVATATTAAFSSAAAMAHLVNSHQALITNSCRECGPSCPDCNAKTQRRCKRCRQGYCLLHNLGSSPTHCDWCCAPSYRYVQQPRVSLKSHY
ncbi:ubiquitin fusion degradation protein [Niveomyces insectorum RCEF 264]|uniref:Ubiquitin fusion degradation protein n=1 Tax=Niveomyces insectorum RCEF 264 TaxID=1081102 RepID=A0A167XZH3_9HYPO|nr:ubiquitin fusion degradation protein [Niveomyces insectorum RCEF 264]